MAARSNTAFSCLIIGVEDGCCGCIWAELSNGVPGLPEPSPRTISQNHLGRPELRLLCLLESEPHSLPL